MIWEDVLLPRWFAKVNLARAFGLALYLHPQQVVVVDDALDGPGLVTAATPLLLQRTAVRGDFRLHVAAFPRHPELLIAPNEWTVLRAICAQLGVTCLAPDDGLADTIWWAIRPGGAVDRVLLNAEDLEHDEYRMVRDVTPARAPIPA